MWEDNPAIHSRANRRLVTALAFCVLAIWSFPVLWMILTAIKPSVEITSKVPVFVFEPTLDHFRVLFEQYHFAKLFLNSTLVATFTTIVALVLGCPAAYGLGCLEIKRSDDVAVWILSQRMLPPIAVIIPFFILYRRAGLIDTIGGLVIVNLVQALPFAVWLLRGFFRDVPMEVREAAILDRLRPWQILMRIVVPLALPGIAVTAIFTFIFAWNEFVFALFLTSERAVTATVGVSQLILAYQVLWGEVAAAGTLALVPLVPIVLYMQEYIVRGMTLGAVK